MPRASNHRKADLKTFQALDAMPSPLRQEVCFAARVWDATMIEEIYQDKLSTTRWGRDETISWLVKSIEHGDEQELLGFAHQHLMKHRYPLPHLAAEATILRFQPAIGVRSGKARRAVPLDVRAAWRSSERLMPVEGHSHEIGDLDLMSVAQG